MGDTSQNQKLQFVVYHIVRYGSVDTMQNQMKQSWIYITDPDYAAWVTPQNQILQCGIHNKIQYSIAIGDTPQNQTLF